MTSTRNAPSYRCARSRPGASRMRRCARLSTRCLLPAARHTDGHVRPQSGVRLDGRQPGRRTRDDPDGRRVGDAGRLRDGARPPGERVVPAQHPVHDLPARPHRAGDRREGRRDLPLPGDRQRYRNDPDSEVKDYCTGQTDRATKLVGRARTGPEALPGPGLIHLPRPDDGRREPGP